MHLILQLPLFHYPDSLLLLSKHPKLCVLVILKSRSHEGVLHAIAYLKQAEDSKGYTQWHKVQWEEQCPSVNTGARADASFH